MKNWFDSLNEIITYIENNLEEEISYDELSKMMGYSIYHLQRLFLMVAGVSLSEYIRCRRLSKAAQELISQNSKIIDLAYKYGYSSPTSFNRAFKAFHGVTPKELKKDSVVIKAYPPLTFELSIKGASSLDYRVVHTEAFKIVGKKIHTTMENGISYRELPEFWQQIQQNGEIPGILSLMNQQPMGLLGVSDYNPNLDQSEFDYYIAAATTLPTPEGYEELTIPAATWAAFPHKLTNPEDMQKFQHQIVMDWLPSSGYQFAFGPDLEVYGKDDTLETWIPVTEN
ncbi:AraC family transcriptional regulator [Enterococcus sp. BWM-S5]|uniref:AraC family transcriptional regulator n=1 Tax=Enterococcus larvae TaxID=2794352 RepID=A0ABS4CFY4_9ENTE|nr:AraC family transcriptional regulator [Enterococcus larvae]MBP1045350.1 AraC family transcriptional regulator [Enterococcus larvae]